MNTHAEDITLLLVEDDDVDAMSIQRGFRRQRISNPMIRAHDGLEALDILKSGRIPQPFVILLDLQMPRMNGLEFLHELRNDPELSASVVFVLTTSKAEEDIVASYRNYIAGYFIKDDSGSSFLDIVNMLDGYWKVVQLPEPKLPQNLSNQA